MWGEQSMTRQRRLPLVISAACAMLMGTATALAQQPAQTRVALGRQPSELMLAAIFVSDIVKSYDFYTKVIGLTICQADGAPRKLPPSARDGQQDFVEIPLNFSGSVADAFFVLVKKPGTTPTKDAGKLTIFGFKVPDVRAAVERVRKAGYEIVSEPHGAQTVTEAMVRDPDGYTVEFIEAPANSAPAK
jgi:catechol 2,3-dioxygenase-like lactoylglutathione lyase family enzyme